MSTITKSFLVGMLVLLATAVAGAASASVSMYAKGTLSIKGFGNDTTTGSVYPKSTLVYLGIPFGQFCNANKGSNSFPCGGSYTSAQIGSPLDGGGLWEKVVASPTAGVPVPFSLPEGMMKKKMGTTATTWQYTGVLPVKRLKEQGNGANQDANRMPGGSFSSYGPYIYSYEYADLRNAAGNFFGGGGPGNFSIQQQTGSPAINAGLVKVTEKSANHFGGSMRLLGFYKTNNGYDQSGIGLSVNMSSNWLFTFVGAGAVSTLGSYTTTAVNIGQNTGAQAQYTGVVKVSAFPWTTGTATVTATRGPFFSIFARSGYDNRAANGLGNIQLVSPMLTHWTCALCDGGAGSDYETGGIGVMNLEFVPEPANALMLVAGISLLGLVYRGSRRS